MVENLNTPQIAMQNMTIKIARDKIEWLGHSITQTGITPLSKKTDAIKKLSSSSNIKKLRSFMGSVHHLGTFIPKLSQICYPFRPLLKKHKNCLDR